MANDKNPEDKLHHLLDALAESVADASDEELRADATAEGRDIHKNAGDVKRTLFDAVTSVRKQRLHAASTKADERIAALQKTLGALPASPAAQRSLLDRVLRQRPDMKEITLQNRDFKTLTNSDVEVLLKQLQHLGLIDDDENDPK